MVRQLSKNISGFFWDEDKGLTSIFILLCISNFLVIPFFDRHKSFIFFASRIIWFFLLFAGITSMSKSRSQMRKFSIIPVLLIVVSILTPSFENKILDYFEFVVQLSVFALLIGMVLVKVFENGSVTVHRIIGSIVVYMLISNVWSQIYQFIYSIVPGSIQFAASDQTNGVTASSFLYFSYSTLTTTGYGDILPMQAITRTLVIIEQLIGVLYPVVLIGRLVSLVGVDASTGAGTKEGTQE
jgi:hypothetical protein